MGNSSPYLQNKVSLYWETDPVCVRLMTVTANAEAVELYRKLGFRLVRTAPFDYGALTPRLLAPLLRRLHGVRDLHYELRITGKEARGKKGADGTDR